MIVSRTGNILDSGAQAIVNTVNEVGVMGKGLALAFKERHPENFAAYARACSSNSVKVGSMFVTAPSDMFGPKWIVNFPTKRHWRDPSQIGWVRDGLADLKAWIVRERVSSIAVPPLGCGNGGLSWKAVRPLVVAAIGDIEGCTVELYEP